VDPVWGQEGLRNSIANRITASVAGGAAAWVRWDMASEITRDLNAAGGPRFREDLYRQLRGLAQRELRRAGPRRTLNATALVNEAWLKLALGDARWSSREHFLATMARVMRHVLIDYARERGAQRRGGGDLQITLDADAIDDSDRMEALELLAIDRALEELSRLDPRLERVIELRFFGGMTVPEIAAALEVSEPTVKRDLRSARAFIAAELGDSV
jgi:RNA polymerase sigma factor (TIGR02999 family)